MKQNGIAAAISTFHLLVVVCVKSHNYAIWACSICMSVCGLSQETFGVTFCQKESQKEYLSKLF